MWRFRLPCIVVPALAVVLAGCKTVAPRAADSASPQSSGQAEWGIPVSRPATPAPDVRAAAAYTLSSPVPGGLTEAGTYRLVKPYEAQCRATANCPLAAALCAENGIAGGKRHKEKSSQRSEDVLRQARAYRAGEERNKAAGRALELFYLLAEAEAGRDFLRQSKDKTEAMLGEVKELQGQGIRVEKGPAQIRRQRLDLLDREAELQLSLVQLHSNLRLLLGCPAEDQMPIWPDVDWKVVPAPIDPGAAVSLGLYYRPDLNLLRMLIQCLDADTLDAARSGLGSVSSLLGASPIAACWLSHHLKDEVDSRRSQLCELLAGKERAATEEIRQAVAAIDVRLRQIAVAKQKVDQWQEQLQVQRMERQRPRSMVTALDIAATELQCLDARRELIHQVLALRIAEAKLKEAQGLLDEECNPPCGN